MKRIKEEFKMKIRPRGLISLIVTSSLWFNIATAWATTEQASGLNVFNIINAIVAVSAFVLSQLPPIRRMIKGKKLRQVIASQLQFTHDQFGLTYIYMWIDLENIGGKALTIKRLKGFLFLGDKLLQPLETYAYYLTESLSSERQWQIPFSEIALKPDERWSKYIILADTYSYSKDIEVKSKSLLLKIKEDFTKKESERNKKMADISIENRPPIEIEPSLVSDALSIVDKVKKLQIGDYKLLVCAYDDPDDKKNDKKPLAAKGYEFTLYHDQINDIFIDIDKEQYKYGYGLYLHSPLIPKVVYINVRPISSERTQELINSL